MNRRQRSCWPQIPTLPTLNTFLKGFNMSLSGIWKMEGMLPATPTYSPLYLQGAALPHLPCPFSAGSLSSYGSSFPFVLPLLGCKLCKHRDHLICLIFVSSAPAIVAGLWQMLKKLMSEEITREGKGTYCLLPSKFLRLNPLNSLIRDQWVYKHIREKMEYMHNSIIYNSILEALSNKTRSLNLCAK